MGFAYNELGAYAEAQRALAAALAGASRLGIAGVLAATKHNLGWALARLGRLDEARSLEVEAVRAFHAQGDRRMESGSRTYLARIHLLAGELDAAEREATAAVDLLVDAPPAARACALASLAQALLAQDRPDDALAHARAAIAPALDAGRLEEGEALVRLAHAEALHAVGEDAAARRAIAAAEQRLLERAAAIGDPAWRSLFLEAVPEHARTVALAAEWRR
jgi:tetratricopeptide (TPR) repeat protein